MLIQRKQPIDPSTITAMERIRDAARSGDYAHLNQTISTELVNRPRSVELANVASAAYLEIGDVEASALMLAFSLLVAGRTSTMEAKLADRLRARGLERLSQALQDQPRR